MKNRRRQEAYNSVFRHKTMKRTNSLHYTTIETFAKPNLVYYCRCFSSHHLRNLHAAISSAEEQWPCWGKPMYSSPLCRLLSPVLLSSLCFCPFLCLWYPFPYFISIFSFCISADEQLPLPVCLCATQSSAVTCAFAVSVFLSISLPNIYFLYTHRCICVCADVKFPWVLMCDSVACCHLCLCLYSVTLSVSALKYGFPLCMTLSSVICFTWLQVRAIAMSCHCPYICAFIHPICA